MPTTYADTLADFPHTTSGTCSPDEPRVGIDLFDGDPPGHTAIYVRFADGTRWPCRTVEMADAPRAASIIGAWRRQYPYVLDYRS